MARARFGMVRISMIIAAAGWAWSASGQDRPASPPPRPPAPPAGVLGGPAVEAVKPPGPSAGFGGDEGFRKGEKRLSADDISRALREAVGPRAPEAVRASPELMEKLKGIESEFRGQQRAFMEEHREELRKLRELGFDPGRGRDRPEGGKGRPPGVRRGGPDGEPPMAAEAPMGDVKKEDREAVLAQAKALRENAPKPDDMFKKAWALLSAEQQQAVQAKLDEQREKLNRREAEQYVQRRLERGGPPGGPGEPGGPGRGRPGRGPGVSPEQRDRFNQALERLSPEERDELMRRLQDRMRDRGEGPGAKGPRGQRGPGRQAPPPPPPPPSDGVLPPPPDER